MTDRPRPVQGGSGAPDAMNNASGSNTAAAMLPGGVDVHLALRAARAGCTVLITGETGVGKGWLARWVHEHSPRAAEPFVPVNCGAIPDTIIDSHLFGHARGSFTGATQEHPGMIRAAAKGSLLLDEVSELPPSAQVRLLRLLQEREAQPVGYSRPITVDVRVIAATNIDLHSAVKTGKFREDLLYRLDVVRLHVRPLRERQDELASLIDAFNCEFAVMHHRDVLKFTSEAVAYMRRSRWPGNVRQVRTVMERLHVLCPHDRITTEDLAMFGGLGGDGESNQNVGVTSVDQVRLEHVQRVVEQSRGSVSRAADRLGVHRSTLYRWLRDQDDLAND